MMESTDSKSPPLATTTKNLFSTDELVAKISRYSVEKVKGKEYVAYHIDCQLKDLQWSVQKRYSECLTFHTRISSTIVTKEKGIEFPPKLITGNFNVSKIEQRLMTLQQWFDNITDATNVVYGNYEALVHEFLETEPNIVKIIAQRCKVDEAVAKEKLNEYTTFLSGLPDYNRAIEAILEEKTQQVMQLSQQDYTKSRKALCEHGSNVDVAVNYLLDIKRVMDETKQNRAVAVTLYYRSGSIAENAIETFKKEQGVTGISVTRQSEITNDEDSSSDDSSNGVTITSANISIVDL
jgi:hypothetical protein